MGNPAHSRRKAVGRISVARSLSNVSAELSGPRSGPGCGRSQAIDRFLFGHAGVASHPVPGHFVPDAGAPQLLPEGLILNRRAVARAPISRSPQRQQFRHARDQIAAVRENENVAGRREGVQAFHGGAEFHPVVRGALFGTGLFSYEVRALPDAIGPATGAGIAEARAVAKQKILLFHRYDRGGKSAGSRNTVQRQKMQMTWPFTPFLATFGRQQTDREQCLRLGQLPVRVVMLLPE